MSESNKSNKFFDKANVESRYTGETNYSSLSIPKTFSGDVDSLSASLYKELDMITIIANKQILAKEDWSDFNDNSGVDTAALLAELVKKLMSVEASIKKNMSTQEELAGSLSLSSKDMDQLTAKYESARKTLISSIEKYNTELADAESKLHYDGTQFEKLESEINKLNTDISDLEIEIDGYNQSLRPLVVKSLSISNIKTGILDITGKIQSDFFSDSTEKNWPTISAMIAEIESFSNSSAISENNFVVYPTGEDGSGTTLYGHLYGLVVSLNNMMSGEGERPSDATFGRYAYAVLTDLVAGIENKLSQLKAAIEIIEANLVKSERLSKMYSIQLRTNEEEIKMISEEISSLKVDISNLRDKIKSCYISLDSDQKNYNDVSAKLKSEIDSYVKQLSEMKSEAEYLYKVLADLKKQIANLKGEGDTSKA